MIHIPSARTSIFLFHVAVVSLLLVIGDMALAAQNTQFKGIIRTEISNSPAMEVQFWTGDEQLRMDITNPVKMSVVWAFGDEPNMRMLGSFPKDHTTVISMGSVMSIRSCLSPVQN